MAFRFWRRIKIAPGVTLNLSKSGGSLSFGPRGAKFTAGSRGRRVIGGYSGNGTLLHSGSSRKRIGWQENPFFGYPGRSFRSRGRSPDLGFFQAACHTG